MLCLAQSVREWGTKRLEMDSFGYWNSPQSQALTCTSYLLGSPISLGVSELGVLPWLPQGGPWSSWGKAGCEQVWGGCTPTLTPSSPVALQCSTCSKCFLSRTELRLHEAFKHRGEKLFVCEECGHRASSRNGLQMHIKAKHRYSVTCVLSYVTLALLAALPASQAWGLAESHPLPRGAGLKLAEAEVTVTFPCPQERAALRV